MSRVLLVGAGPLPGPDSVDTSFAELRLSQLHAALSEEHEVHVCTDPQAAIGEVRPDVVVTAGTYGPTRAALGAIGDQPLCVDLPGDPFADAQMVAAFGAADAVADDALSVFVPALARADAFLTIGRPSRYAILGQLGVLGRLARTPPGEEWVAVTPVAWHFPGLAEGAPRSDLPPRVALVGGFNTWFDTETLLDGLLLAMDRSPVTVRCVGGPIPGHHTLTAERFRAAASASRHAPRFQFLERLPTRELSAAVADCTVGVVLDRPGYEPELGSRTRMLWYLHQGLPVVGTARCELARDLTAGGWLREVPPQNPQALADALATPVTVPDRAPLRERYSLATTTVGLRAWVARPRRRIPAANADALMTLQRERDAVEAELAAVRASPTWRALDRLRRAFPRR